ncbi:hypothetical protein C6P40_001467 [Pichia californica]|uniref:Transcription initiation factor IIF subunit alpha n=1 Tax=Pichia californica TaxID=460514 RepID=A0A9P6WL59_9ASCO|nr:hypothetical protein C6P42_004201 [[Candida] californica]KAG0688048.1 hypothetical protein C6P40_001467 [[Candida] californica]
MVSEVTKKTEPEYDTFPLRACNEEELDETRFHILKFHSVKKIDPLKDFQEPTRLHRKDPKNLQFQMSLKELEEKKKDDEEKEKQQIIKRQQFIERTGKKDLTDEQIDEELEVEGLEEKDRKIYDEKKKKEQELKEKEEEKEKQMQLVAPDGGARKQKKQLIKKRTKQVKAYNETKRKLRYEEFYPWVLEDYDADQAWVGNYEAGINDNYCLLILDNVNKCFKLAPVEKFYKFTSRNKYATLTLEEAEAKMKQGGGSGQRWLMRKMLDEATTGKRVDLRYRKIQKINVDGTAAVADDDDDGSKRSDEDEALDYDDEFQDDEEAPIMEGPDDEKKLIESKMKKEMLSANNLIEKVPVDGDEEEEDDEDFDDLFDIKKEDKESKKLRKALSRNAMNEVYASEDEEENPYLSESEIESDSENDDESKVKKENIEDNDIKVKEEPNNNNDDIKVKTEPNDGDEFETSINTSKSSNPKKKKISKPKNSITYLSGFVTIRASKQILSQFPSGDWNPRTAIRRDLTEEQEEEPSNPNILTSADIENLLVNGPIELSTLVKALRGKMQRDPNSKHVLKQLLKENFTLLNKQVHRKEN